MDSVSRNIIKVIGFNRYMFEKVVKFMIINYVD